MSTGSPVNDYGVVATLTVATSDESTANSAAAEALTDIAAALAGLSENVGFSVGKDETTGEVAWAEKGGDSYSVQGQLTIGASATSGAQSIAEDAAAAIATALSGDDPAVTVTLEEENGEYVFEQF